MKSYGQFCGLSRAVEALGERWTLIVIRDLLVSAKRFNELRYGIPGIPSNLLATRLRELEAAGIVERAFDERAVIYQLTAYGRDLEPIVNALGLWGARRMAEPAEGELPTENSLAAALMAARTDARVEPFTVAVEAGPVMAHAQVTTDGVRAFPGDAPDAQLRLSGPGLRRLMATGDLEEARGAGGLSYVGPEGLVQRFTSAFRAPLDGLPA
ncbi:helix-turn-helix transcriptional regulator [Micrococcus luteus]|nr:helix-turn-helix transcriptional regulator [Micrococcus luteus]